MYSLDVLSLKWGWTRNEGGWAAAGQRWRRRSSSGERPSTAKTKKKKKKGKKRRVLAGLGEGGGNERERECWLDGEAKKRERMEVMGINGGRW